MDPVERLYMDAMMEDPAVPAHSLRPQLLAGARARRRPAAPTAVWAEPYAGRVAAMDALLASAVDDDWSRVIVEGWTLQELVAHLAAKDGLLAASVGAPVLGPPIGALDSVSRTGDVQAYERERSPEQTRRDWRAQADALCRHVAGLPPTTLATLDGMEVVVRDHILARGLETWVHTTDAAKMAEIRLPDPIAEHIRPTADLCARLLPWTMLFSGLDAAGRTLHLTLTGDGGGEWLLPLGVADTEPGEPDAHITADVVGFCFLLGGRGAPADFPAELNGDLSLARDVLNTAPALSGP
ncbi:Mycothiol maleylpyruvate isomerase N-terminal domain-containing protein [Nonomuraea solani]|uniref:Mycothiol maleylpyruvate isomerase N-terminal domain-containing protein n=1 Tax=Nonomuraea solani TaxID=1144553 RepID=A0A1H5ZEF1_9ACTN|nr:maleylpyruvate isomerase N-terminal domain-containing protein [Nonomuraea solani]SEG34017.1 Mycothiol maleylpyruvate isomerase N-terminal domain-containing protein [Nonomuraea solani]